MTRLVVAPVQETVVKMSRIVEAVVSIVATAAGTVELLAL